MEALELLDECEVNLALLEARGLLSVPYNNKTRKADWTDSIGMQWTRFLKLSMEMVPMKCQRWVPDHERIHCFTCNTFLNPFQRGVRHHCRSCGEIFCHDCTSHQELIYERRDGLKIPIDDGKPCRICKPCYEKCTRARTVVQYCISPGLHLHPPVALYIPLLLLIDIHDMFIFFTSRIIIE